jgi:phosphatidylglycerol:prolipoprotein diacylglycerol transferase
MFLFGIIGARIAYFLLYPDQFNSLSQIIFIWEGGLVSYGGFVLGGLTFLILLKFQKQPVLAWFDALAVGFPLGLFFGRIGDVLTGDYSGAEKFTTFSSLKSGVPLPFYEAALCLLIFFIALALYLKKDRIVSGLVFLITLLLYSGGRFIIDFWRSESGLIWKLSLGQVFGLTIFIASLVAIILLLRVQKKGEQDEFAS